jgi:hypothetical protein
VFPKGVPIVQVGEQKTGLKAAASRRPAPMDDKRVNVTPSGGGIASDSPDLASSKQIPEATSD